MSVCDWIEDERELNPQDLGCHRGARWSITTGMPKDYGQTRDQTSQEHRGAGSAHRGRAAVHDPRFRCGRGAISGFADRERSRSDWKARNAYPRWRKLGAAAEVCRGCPQVDLTAGVSDVFRKRSAFQCRARVIAGVDSNCRTLNRAECCSARTRAGRNEEGVDQGR